MKLTCANVYCNDYSASISKYVIEDADSRNPSWYVNKVQL